MPSGEKLNSNSSKSSRNSVAQASTDDALHSPTRPPGESTTERYLKSKTVSEDQLDSNYLNRAPAVTPNTKSQRPKPKISLSVNDFLAESQIPEDDIFNTPSQTERTSDDEGINLTALSMKESKRQSRSSSLIDVKKKRSSQGSEQMLSAMPASLSFSGPVSACLSIPGLESVFFALNGHSIHVYRTAADYSSGGKAIKVFDLEGAAAFPTFSSSECLYDFDIEFLDFTISCQCSSLKHMLMWVAVINSSAIGVSFGTQQSEHLKKNRNELIFNYEHYLIRESFNAHLGLIESSKSIPLPDATIDNAEIPGTHKLVKSSCIITYEKSDNSSNVQIRGVTADSLIEQLTGACAFDSAKIRLILYCFRHVIAPSAVLQKLSSKLNGLNSENDPTTLGRAVLKQRAIFVLKLWIEQCYLPDFIDKEMKSHLDSLITSFQSPHGTSKAEIAENKLHRPFFENLFRYMISFNRRLEALNQRSLQSAQELISPTKTKSGLSIVNIDPIELSNSLLKRDYELYRALTPLQFLVRLWQDESISAVSRCIAPINDLIHSVNNVFLSYV